MRNESITEMIASSPSRGAEMIHQRFFWNCHTSCFFLQSSFSIRSKSSLRHSIALFASMYFCLNDGSSTGFCCKAESLRSKSDIFSSRFWIRISCDWLILLCFSCNHGNENHRNRKGIPLIWEGLEVTVNGAVDTWVPKSRAGWGWERWSWETWRLTVKWSHIMRKDKETASYLCLLNLLNPS